MKKVTLLFLMLFGAIGFAQQTTLKSNGVDNPIYYNTHSKAKTVVLTESQQAADANLKNLGENKPFFINEQQNKPNAVTSKANGAVGAASQGLGVNNPIFTNDRGNRSTVPATQNVGENAPQYLFMSRTDQEEILAAEAEAAQRGVNNFSVQNEVRQRRVLSDIIPTAGATENFAVNTGDFFYDPSDGVTGGPGGNCDATSTGDPGDYPNCGCITTTTLTGTGLSVEFLSFNVFGTFDYLNIYDGPDTSSPKIYDSNLNTDTDTLAGMIAANGSGVFTSTSDALTFEFNATAVVNTCGWEVEVLSAGGGGGSAYCIPEGTNSGRFIDNFSTTGGSENISNMGSGFSAGGYGDFYDTDTVTQEQNGTVDFSVDIEGGTAGFRVWVDWNQDDEFDVTEEVAYASNSYENSHTGTITVPADALEGDTRMRIVSHWLSTTGDVDPCATGFTYGEFEDYKFTVTAGGGGGGGVCTTPVIEVNQDVDDTCMAFIAPGIAQSYIPLESEAAGAGIKFTDPSTGLNVDLSLWDNLPNAGGTMLTSGTTDTDGTNWADVLWDDVVSVTVGNTYYIVVEGDPTLPCLAGSTNDPYPGGMTYANGFSPFPTFDYTFRTFSCDSGGGGNACSQDNPENAFENGFTTSKDGLQIIATDINVPADTDFSLEKMTVNIWTTPGETITSADITFYDNAADLPGGIRNAYPAVVPVSQTVIGSNFGYDISEVVFEITPEMLPGTAGSISRYWVSLYLDISAGSGFIGSTSATIEGVPSAFSPDAGVTWNVNAGNDTVYIFEGECESIGGGGGGPCATTAPSNAFENGKSFTKNLGRIVANDITVVDGEDMLLESITFTAFIGSTGSGVNADNVDVTFYEDDGSGAPGAPYDTPQLSLVPTSQVIIGGNFGYDAWSIELDIADVNLVGQTGSDTTYWIGLSLEPTDGSNTFWEYSTAAVVGLAQAYDDGTGVGFIVEAGIEGVYSFDGTCSPTGGGGTGDPCATTAPSNAFENGKSFTKNLGRIVANDITVVDGEDMLLESITFTAFIGSTGSGVNADNVDVTFYEDNGSGAPGAPYDTPQLSFVPTSQVLIGGNFGYDAWSIELDIADVNLVGQTGSDTTYWIGLSLEPTDGSNTFWEYSTAAVVGLAQAYDDGTGVGFIVEAGIEGVYSFDGTCSPTGGGGGCTPVSLSTLYDAGNNGSPGGAVYFDLTVEDSDIDVLSFDLHTEDLGAFTVDVYMFEGTYVGNQADPAMWGTSVATGSGDGAGAGLPSTATLDNPISMLANTTYAVALVFDATHSHYYTNGDGTNQNYSNGDISLDLGSASNTPFVDPIFDPRIWNGGVGYCVDGGGGGITNDECSGAIAVSCGDSVSGTTVGATIDSGAPTCGPSITSPGVWYTLDDNSGIAGDITVSLCNGTTFDTKLSIYTGTCSALVCVDGNDDSCGLQSEVTFASDGNTQYYILVHSFGGATGAFTLDITCDPIGISENVFEGFSYYPNPTSDILNLNSIDNIESVSLYNLLGQRVIDNQVNATTSKVDVSGLSTGTYLMRVTVNGQTATYKVLKQ